MSTKKIVFSILIALVSGFLVVSMINFFHKGNLEIFRSLIRVDPAVYLVAFALFTGSYLFEALRLNVVLSGGGYGLKFRDSLVNNILGYVFSYLTPFAMGGQPFQVYHMSRLGVDSGYATGVMAARILENSLGSTVIAIIVLNTNMAWMVKRGQIVFLGITISFSVSAFLILAMIRPHILVPLISFFSRVFKREHWIDDFLDWIGRFKKGLDLMWRKNLKLMFIDIGMWFVTLAVQLYSLYYVITKLTNEHPGFWRVFGLINAVNALAYFIPTPGSSGGIEATYQIVLSALIGKPNEVLLSVTVWRIVAYYIQILIGVILLWKIGKGILADRE